MPAETRLSSAPPSTAPVSGGGRPRRTPIRTCVACRTAGGKRGLLRVVRLPDGSGIAVDPTGKRSGRGAYLCPTSACLVVALKRKALERSLKTAIPETVVATLSEAIAQLEALPETGQPEPTAESPPGVSAMETVSQQEKRSSRPQGAPH